LEWPGHGSVPPDPRVSRFEHLVALVVPGGSHGFAEEQPEVVAPYIASHLALEL